MNNQKVLNAVSGWIVAHTRATDTVMFGPFSSLDDARTWLIGEGAELGARGMIMPLIKPDCDPDVMWTGAGSIIDACFTSNA
jgi:hypothetical protein